MSLTGFLSASSDIQDLFQTHFPLPHQTGRFPSMRAAPQTKHYALVGQAFDYLLRFHIQRHNPAVAKPSHWVADIIRGTLCGEDDESRQRRAVEAAALPYLEAAHLHHQQYLTDGQITDHLLASCLNLAVIDGLVRAGELRGSLGVIDPKDLRDLRHLHALIPCVLNPNFPFPSGADCDLLLGDTLIEIKTTKYAQLRQEYYHQLLGYYLLNLTSAHPHPIQRLGMYFSRHGYLRTIAVQDIADAATFLRFVPTWQAHVHQYHTPDNQTRATSSHPTKAPSTLDTLIAQAEIL